LSTSPAPTLESLYSALAQPPPVPTYHHIDPESIPEPYRHLLVHDRHMTVAMEEHHRCPIAVRVLQRQHGSGWYARQIVLTPVGSERVLQGGVVRIHLDLLDEEVREAILREDTPLGKVLIDHDIMRHIEVTGYLRFEPGPGVAAWPGFSGGRDCYGRLGIIHCNGLPAVELLEIIPPM
jgi:chorismate-pyruvate lyase